MDAAYWYPEPALPGAVRAGHPGRCCADGRSLFVECSPHPVLTIGVQETAEDEAVTVGTLRRDDGGPDRFLASLAEVWCAGVDVDFTGFVDGGRRIELPTYAFQRQRYWPMPLPAVSRRPRTRTRSRAGSGTRWSARTWQALAGTLQLEQAPGTSRRGAARCRPGVAAAAGDAGDRLLALPHRVEAGAGPARSAHVERIVAAGDHGRRRRGGRELCGRPARM